VNTTGERIRDLRQQNHLTLDDVAKYLGVGRQTIYKYEHGTVTNIPLENLEKMAALFGTTPGYLAGWSDDHPADPVPSDQPRTPEAKLLAIGVDKMPQEQREQALNVFRAVFAQYADFFDTKGTDDK
jgi:transcriptional regulator with XRE-family HTH domain